MLWQDIILFTATVIMGYALIPQIYQNCKNKKCSINIQTSSLTFISLYVMAVTFLTLNLYLTFIIDLVIGTLWLVLFLQRLAYR